MENFAGKKRPIINLSLFTTFPGSLSSEKSMKSPRDFEGGVVGLGIVAAMTNLDTNLTANLSPSPRSRPIPIVSPARPAANFKGGGEMAREDELSESYTCVISHIGNSSVKKRVYLDDNTNGVVLGDCSSASAAACVDSDAVFSASPLNFGGDFMTEFGAPDFLSSCFLCNKQLHGLDIFMYRGEKAFCSADCRGKHMRSDKRKEKCRSEALEYSMSPCSGPMVFFAGVAAA